ncbi:MAG: hypothetical protein RLZZ306_392 [Bacteroidota bacterium]|jgi:type I site-specific restriction endonuclease
MAFTSFRSLSEVIKKYQIKYQEELFPAFEINKAPEVLREDISFTLQNVAYNISEPAICENLIYPILKAAWRPFAKDLAIWSHQPIMFTEELSGVPDYLISRRSELGKIVLDYPLLAVVEAKKDDFKAGWAQCGSEMYAIQQLNQTPEQRVFGIVSNGETWEFAQLSHNTLTMFTQRYDIQELDVLYSALETIYQFSLENALIN